jgi:hypothetical protein
LQQIDAWQRNQTMVLSGRVPLSVSPRRTPLTNKTSTSPLKDGTNLPLKRLSGASEVQTVRGWAAAEAVMRAAAVRSTVRSGAELRPRHACPPRCTHS